MKLVRPALCLALAATTGTGLVAQAVEAPKTSTTSKTLYLSQNGCGSTAEAGRLEEKVQSDSADGCGTIGGVPLAEVEAADESDFGPLGEDFTTTVKLKPIKLNSSKSIVGQLGAGSWAGNGTGGVGTVTFDVRLTGVTTAGKAVELGSVQASAPAAPGQDTVDVPFTLPAPSSASGVVLKALTLTVFQRGQNVGMSARRLNGESYVVIPAKK